ncbi:hypothetical protein Tco_0511790 [Tanacetum coccineum]
MTYHVTDLDKANQANILKNESLTAELQRYKEHVRMFEKRQNVDLSSREKFIESQMDDLIHEKNAKRAQRIKPMLYDGSVISKQQNVISMIDSEETLILEEDSNLNSNKPITSSTPVKIEVPKELPKISLVNESPKKLKCHLANFDTVVKVRTTPDAISEVQTVFNQMESAMEQCSVQKAFEIE